MSKHVVRSRFTKIDRVVAPVGGPSKCQAHFADECDINKILAKYRKTGAITHVRAARAKYGEFADFTGLADAWEPILRANSSFQSLPAELRNKFGNDIKSFLAFIDDPKNFQECVTLGIYDPLPKEDPIVTPPPPAQPASPDSQDPIPPKSSAKK